LVDSFQCVRMHGSTYPKLYVYIFQSTRNVTWN